MAIHPIEYRYGSKDIREIFEEEKKLEYQLKVEKVLIETLAEFGIVPQRLAKIIVRKANLKFVPLEEVRKREKEIKHDIMAFVTVLSEACGKAGKYVHLTATSYDIVDTVLALQLKEAIGILIKKGKKLLESCLRISQKYKGLVMIGRTHGQHALPITLGFKFANFSAEIGEDIKRLVDDQKYVLGKFSGAVGTQASQKVFNLPIEFEKRVLEKLDLKPAEISTQVVARENIARILADIVVFACSIEKIAKEIRNLQRTEILELAEPFSKRQVGSSAMPQKRNPWQSESICSNVKVIRGLLFPALENIALEHERDLTNSAAERSIIPTIFVLADEILEKMITILENLEVFPENMKKNLELTQGRILAERILNELVKKGLERQIAHSILREIALESEKEKKSFQSALFESKKIKKYFKEEELGEMLKYENYLGFAIQKTEKIVKKWKSFLKQISH